MVAVVACGPKKEAPKTLVLYYSQTANTEKVAQLIAEKTGSDIERIVPVSPYDGTFEETIKRSSGEKSKGILPEIKPIKADISKYDVIFLGYPVWFGTMAPPVERLLSEVDFAGKKIVPFCTFGSGGLVSSTKDIVSKQPGAEVLEGYGVRAARMASMPSEVERFLIEGGFIEGEVAPLAAYSELKAVSEEEAAIFDAAVEGYPMLHAKAMRVASRPISGGTEYLFTALDAVPGVKPEIEIKVYVTALDGQTPEFTQVVR